MPASPLQPVARYLSRLQHAPASDAELLRQFTDLHDTDAFAELVRRHGRLVLGACRRVLGDAHAAEDAFQLAFMTLARHAAGLRGPGVLPAWLHRVAVRVARRTRAGQQRRRWTEAHRTPPRPPADPLAEVSGRELVSIIDEELVRLPEEYRLPLLLCAVEGLSREEAVRRLGWTEGAVKGRLERGRELLRKRLEGRGLTVPAVLTAVLATDATAAVPRALVATTSKAALAALAAPAAAVSLKALAAGAVVLVALGIGAGAAGLGRDRPESVQISVAPPQSLPQTPPPAAPRVDREGVPLPPGVLARLGSSRLRHGSLVTAAAFSPDGRTLASAGQDGFRVWESTTGKLIHFSPVPRSIANSQIAFAADGHDLQCVTLSPNGSELLRLDPGTGRERLRVDLDKAWMAVISASGRRLAFVNYDDGSLHVADADTGWELQRLTEIRDISGLAFTADDRTLAVANGSDTIAFYDVVIAFQAAKTGELKREKERFDFVTFAPDGRTLATIPDLPNAGGAYEVALWDFPTRQLRHRLTADVLLAPRSASFSPDGRLLAVCSGGTHVVLFDTATGKEFRRLLTQFSALRVAFTPDGRTLAAASRDGTITLWDVDSGRLLPASADPLLGVHALRYADGGRRLIATSDRLTVWDPATGREVHRFPDAPSLIALPVLSPDERLIAVLTQIHTIQISDAATGREVRVLMRGDKMQFASLDYPFTPDGRRLITGDTGSGISVWDVANGTMLAEFGNHRVHRLAVSPDGHWLASAALGAGDTAIRLWDLNTYREVKRFTPRRAAFAVAFSPDSRRLASAGGESGRPSDRGEVQLWDIESGQELHSFEGHTREVSSVAFSPDGRTVATGSADNTLRLWEVATGGERQRITGHAGPVQAAAFAPDGRTLAAASPEAPVYVWDVLNLAQFAGRPPTAAELDDAWAALAGADAKTAFQAIRRLVAAPDVAMPFLRERLKPAAAADAARVRELVRRLDNPNFDERRRATEELEGLGDGAVAELRAALKDAGSAEVRQTVQRLLDRIDAGTAEMLRAQRAVEALEHIGTPAAREHLRALAGGAPGLALTDAAAAALRRRP